MCNTVEQIMIAGRIRDIDTCIAPIVQALNNTGVATIACCCGHGKRPGNIALTDGREIIICPDYKTGRKIDDFWNKIKSDEIKRCTICGRFLGKNNFRIRNTNTKSRRSYCKKCSNNMNKIWRELNIEYARKINRENNKRWYQKNKKKKDQYTSQWRKENPNRIKIHRKRCRQKNKAKYNLWQAKREATKLNQTPDLTREEEKRIIFIYEVAQTMKDYVVDHIKPLSKGGLHHPNNLQILHKNLNQKKYNKWPLTQEEEIRYRGYRL